MLKVHWDPWEQEAFTQAHKSGVPIFPSSASHLFSFMNFNIYFPLIIFGVLIKNYNNPKSHPKRLAERYYLGFLICINTQDPPIT